MTEECVGIWDHRTGVAHAPGPVQANGCQVCARCGMVLNGANYASMFKGAMEPESEVRVRLLLTESEFQDLRTKLAAAERERDESRSRLADLEPTIDVIRGLETERDELRKAKERVDGGLVELYQRLLESEKLLRRGIKMLNPVGWEPGETDEEWRRAAESWVNQQERERKMIKQHREAAMKGK